MLKKIITHLKANKTIRLISWPILTLRNKHNARKNTIYEQVFSNVKQGSLVVSVKDLPGTYEIDIRSRILRRILISKDYEPEICSILKKYLKADRDAINVGANIGIFTILLANLINKDRKVLAVEPTPLAFGYLVSNLKRNNLVDKTILYNGICNDSPGRYILNTIEGKEEFSSIGESKYMANENIIKIEVEGETVNNLVRKFNLNPGIMLIDVEGAEMKVLKGSAEIIEKYKPIIISELSDDLLVKQGNSSAEVIAFLENMGYNVTDTNNNLKIARVFNGNIIAIPNN